MNCRHCKKELSYTFIDLGSSPPSNSYLTELTMKAPENWYKTWHENNNMYEFTLNQIEGYQQQRLLK